MRDLSEKLQQAISTLSFGDMRLQEQLISDTEIFRQVNDQANISHSGETVIFRFSGSSKDVVTAQDVLFVISPGILDDLVDGSTQMSERIAGAYFKRLGRPIAQFTKAYISEVRREVCQNQGKDKKHGTVAGLAGFLVSSAGIQESYATGLAVAILVVLISAATSTFCKLTELELENALERDFPSSD